MDQMRKPGSPASDDGPLDSYSETVMRVAETVTPHVAAIEMTGNRRNGRFRVGAGSAVLFTGDGYLLTNSHVVAGTRARYVEAFERITGASFQRYLDEDVIEPSEEAR